MINSTTSSVERTEQALERARGNLTVFKQVLYRRYMRAGHLDLLDRALTQVSRYVETGGAGGIGRLVIEMPPRHGKTVTTSRFYPAWHLGRNPEHRVMLVSYGASLADKNSRAARNLIRSPYYQAIFPSVELAADSRAVDSWDLSTVEGGVDALGIGGGATGKGAHCFPAGTRILTESGYVPIEALCGINNPPRVLGYDSWQRRTVWACIEASRVVQSTELIEVTTAGGRRFYATPEHPVFVRGRGYIPVERLTVGDHLNCVSDLSGIQGSPLETLSSLFRQTAGSQRNPNVCVLRKNIPARKVSAPKSADAQLRGFLLQSRVLQRSSCGQECDYLRAVWQAKKPQQQILFSGLPQCRAISKAAEDLSTMRGDVCTEIQQKHLLFEGMREPSAFQADARKREPSLQGRGKLRQVVYGNAPTHLGEGQVHLCYMRSARTKAHSVLDEASYCSHEPYNPSHRRKSQKQCGRQPCHHVQDVPRSTPQVEHDTVSAITRVHTPSQPVYDLQVADCHNFFAEGVLVHNCLIIDDPVKNRAEAESETYRERTWEAFTSDLYTRLEPGGAIVIMSTRWHMDDLTGRALQMEGEDWKRLRFPALAEDDDPLGRQEGDALWPARFPQDVLLGVQSALGSYEFASLYQQRPIARTGGLFDPLKIEIVDHAPELERTVRFYDLAVTKKTTSDYTAGVKLGRAKDGRIVVLDVWRDRKELPDIHEAIVQNALIDGAETSIRLEAEKAGVIELAFLLRDRRLSGHRIDAVPPKGDKYTRAGPFASRVNGGQVVMVRGAWNRAFLDELAVFPAGAHDDQVDAASGAYEMIDHQREFMIAEAPSVVAGWRG